MIGYRDRLAKLERLESGEKSREGALTELPKAPSVGLDSEPDRRFPHDADARELTPEERLAWSDALCRRLHEAVARETPTGLGQWEPAWHRVEAPSNALMAALADFEASGRKEERQAAVRLTGELLEAWRLAAAEWERAGKPLPRPAPEMATA